MKFFRAGAGFPAARSFATAALLLAFVSAAFPFRSSAQWLRRKTQHAAATLPASVPVVMLSDIHFDPFQDPAKLPQLRETPIEQWPAVLTQPASPARAAASEALGKACPVRGIDTSWPLFSDSLEQAAEHETHPLFVTVSGDLLAHEFDCRFRFLTPHATAEDVSAFSAKTVAFVTVQLRRAFPGTPVYLALGNNDSGCTDYREDPNSAFLQQTAIAFAAAAGGGENGQAVLRDFSREGDYNILLPAPMQHARLIVLQDLFDARTYKSCAGQPETGPTDAQMDWLHSQLAAAARRGEHVWVMTHIPPGLDVYNTLRNRKVCAGEPPIMFLGSERLADELTLFASTVSLAVFAHTHGDEMRLLHAAGRPPTGDPAAEVPAKLVSSISPVNGNQPTFTVARVDPRTAAMLDYTVFIGSSAQPSQPFVEEYTFSKTYGLPDFTAASLDRLLAEFGAHKAGDTPHIGAYARFVFPGDTGVHAAAVQLLWPDYACSLTEDRPDSFRACACPAEPQPK